MGNLDWWLILLQHYVYAFGVGLRDMLCICWGWSIAAAHTIWIKQHLDLALRRLHWVLTLPLLTELSLCSLAAHVQWFAYLYLTCLSGCSGWRIGSVVAPTSCVSILCEDECHHVNYLAISTAAKKGNQVNQVALDRFVSAIHCILAIASWPDLYNSPICYISTIVCVFLSGGK